LKVKKIVLGFLNVNCYILSVNNTTIIIDAGSGYNLIKKYLENENITPDFLIGTHGHYDHIGVVPELVSNYKIPFYIHEQDEFIVKDPDKNLSSNFSGNGLSLKTYNLINDSSFKYFEQYGLKLFHMPGHTPGSIVIKCGDCLFTGDLLFRCSIGRTDLPGGDIEAIKNSLKKIRKMDENLIVYPGHNENSTLSYEFKNNYYLTDEFLEKE